VERREQQKFTYEGNFCDGKREGKGLVYYDIPEGGKAGTDKDFFKREDRSYYYGDFENNM
jgi:hypothetical protein